MIVFFTKNGAGTAWEGGKAAKTCKIIELINGFSGLWDFLCLPFSSCSSLQANHINSKNMGL